MAFSTDADLLTVVPDILDFGIDGFMDEHALAEAELTREIRNQWWHRKGIAGEMNASLLTSTQWTKAKAYLVLWKYALPKLTNWTAEERFQSMMAFYKQMYLEEINSIFQDGVEYDADESGSISDTEKQYVGSGYLTR